LRSEADRLHDANRAPQDQSQSATAAGAVADQTAAGGEGDPNAPLRLKLIAQEPVWVRASNNGKYLFSETLDANQTREFDGAGQMELVLGNAGGIDIEVNGKSVGAIGPKGQVRTVHISSGGFKIVPRKPSAPLDLF
jgi:hypothetical protein